MLAMSWWKASDTYPLDIRMDVKRGQRAQACTAGTAVSLLPGCMGAVQQWLLQVALGVKQGAVTLPVGVTHQLHTHAGPVELQLSSGQRVGRGAVGAGDQVKGRPHLVA
jgi:hypothetical protein